MYYYAQFKHRPAINKVSRELGQASNLDELVSDTRAKAERAKVRDEVESAERAACTFKPHITARGARAPEGARVGGAGRVDLRASSSASVTREISRAREERDAELEERRRGAQVDEMSGCTFHPATNRGVVVEAAGPVVVRGLGRYLELKELAKRQEEERAAREEKAFATKVRGELDGRREGSIDRWMMCCARARRSRDRAAVGLHVAVTRCSQRRHCTPAPSSRAVLQRVRSAPARFSLTLPSPPSLPSLRFSLGLLAPPRARSTRRGSTRYRSPST